MLIATNFDLQKYIDRFLAYLKRLNRSPETIKGYRKDLYQFSDFLSKAYSGNILTEEIEKEDIIKFWSFQEDKGLKLTSICRYLSTLKSFYKFLVKEMNFKVDVAAFITLPQVFVPLPDVLDFDEMQNLLKTAKRFSEFDHALICCLYYTGSRLTPIRTLTKENVKLKNKEIYFPIVKRGKDLHLPLHDKLCEVLEQHLFDIRDTGSSYVFPSRKFINKPISPSQIRLNLKKIAKLAGIDRNVTPHFVRHCTATHLTILGIDQKMLADILGQSDVRSAARYQHLNVNNLRPSIDKLY